MTNSEIDHRQAEIDARVAAATPGEWKAYGCGNLCDENENDLITDGHDHFCYSISFKNHNDATFCAHAKPDLEWQREQIEALEAENTHLTEWVNAALEANFALAKRNINQCKWARRWKRIAKNEHVTVAQQRSRRKSMELVFGRYEEYISLMRERIAALENAACLCNTCVFYNNNVGTHEECSQCVKIEPETLKNVRNRWVFDERRFASEGSTNNDNTIKTKI